jgi:hypothetical protein
VYLSAAAAAAAQHIVWFRGNKSIYTINNLLQREAPDETENKRSLGIFCTLIISTFNAVAANYLYVNVYIL